MQVIQAYNCNTEKKRVKIPTMGGTHFGVSNQVPHPLNPRQNFLFVTQNRVLDTNKQPNSQFEQKTRFLSGSATVYFHGKRISLF